MASVRYWMSQASTSTEIGRHCCTAEQRPGRFSELSEVRVCQQCGISVVSYVWHRRTYRRTDDIMSYCITSHRIMSYHIIPGMIQQGHADILFTAVEGRVGNAAVLQIVQHPAPLPYSAETRPVSQGEDITHNTTQTILLTTAVLLYQHYLYVRGIYSTETSQFQHRTLNSVLVQESI